MSSTLIRIQKLELEHGKVAEQIKDMKMKIENLEKFRVDLLENPKSQDYLEITKELRGMNEEFDDKSALGLAISRQLEKAKSEQTFSEKKDFLDKVNEWIEENKRTPPPCKQCSKKFTDAAWSYNFAGKETLDPKKEKEEIDQVTPLEDFFIMGSNIPKEMDELVKDPNIFRLEIVGEVENPVNLTYEDLITQFEFKHLVTEMYCTPNLNGVGKFSGPSLYEVIEYAKPVDGNMKVVFNAADGYEKGWYREFPLSEIKAHSEDYLIAVTMNEYPLAIEHGYPARLALDSRQGSLWVKWLIRITIVSEDSTRYAS